MKQILILAICVAMFCGLVGCAVPPSEATVSTDSAPTFSEISVSDTDTAESTLTDTQTDEGTTESSDSAQTTDEISLSDSDTEKSTSTDAQSDEENTESTTVEIHVHSYTNTVVAPTCKETGYTLHECACGESYKDSYTDKTDHVFGPWYVRIPPTHFAEGKESRECMYCDTYEDITLPITPHPTCEDLNIDVYEAQRQVLEYIDTLEGASADTTLVGTDRGGMAGWTLRVFTYAYKTQDSLIEDLKESVFVQYKEALRARDTVKMHVSLEVDWFDSGHYIFTVLYF